MFANFKSSLPNLSVLDLGKDIDEQTRAVLNLLFSEFKLRVSDTTIPVNPANCPNCDRQVSEGKSPYCSGECRETSAFVRQFRHAVISNAIMEPEKQGALGQKLWFVLGGGYPRRDALVPERVRLKVIEREGNKCQQCEAKATTIDHSGSG
jgi:hypothetical protein